MSNRNKSKSVDGVTYMQTHSGQRKEYGDSFYDYSVKSDLPAEDVERVCREKVHKAIPHAQWEAENKSADDHFRSHYKFKSFPDGTYLYSVCFPYAD